MIRTRLTTLATLATLATVLAGGCASRDAVPLSPPDYILYDFPNEAVRVRAATVPWRESQRRNVVIQRLDYSCGSAALATLLRYYFEDNVNEATILKVIFERLAKADNPQAEARDRIANGFSMLDLLNAAKDLNYLGAVVRIPMSKLAESQAPVIVRIIKFDYKHFVVVRGVHDDTVYLADPIRGNIRVSVQEFLEQWSGEALFLGKAGFGLPQDHPLAITREGPARPELDVARQALYPILP